MEPKCNLCGFFGEKPHCHNCKVFKQADRAPQKIECSDEEFIEYINTHKDITERFSVGDYKFIDTYTGERLKIVIADTNKDLLADGSGKARVTLSVSCIDGLFEMNKESTNETSWENCKMRTVYMDRIFKILPKIYRDNIKPVFKLTSAGARSREIIQTEDRLFLFSESEVFGEPCYSYPGEGEQYELFTNLENRKFSKPTWLRSPTGSGSTYFCFVYSGGSADGNGAGGSSGVSFGFCI